MCHVQRVLNSCGHTNDHVTMACYVAKSALPSKTQNSSAGQSKETDTASTTVTQAQSLNPTIQMKGFDARTEPYCAEAHPKDLTTPKGFKCMVEGCGTAD